MQRLRLVATIGNDFTLPRGWQPFRNLIGRGMCMVLRIRAYCGKLRQTGFSLETKACQKTRYYSQTTLKDYTGSIRDCGRQQLWYQALALLDDMYLLHRLEPDMRAYCAVISACSKGGRWEKALQLLELAHSKQVALNEFAYSPIISACGRSSRWECVIGLLELMYVKKVNQNIVVCNSAISACEKGHRWEQALCYLANSLDAGLSVDVVSFNAAISACEKGHQWVLSLGLFFQMQDISLSPNAITFNALISACGKGDCWSHALALLDEMKQMQPKITRNAISYSAAMNACVRGEEWEFALRLFTEMRQLKLEPNEVVYNAAIGAYSKGRQWQQSVEVLNQLKSPDLISFSTAINALEGDNWAMAIYMLDRMQHVGINPDVVTFSALLSVFENAHLWERSLNLLGHMRQRYVEPNEISYVLAISACEKSRQPASAVHLLKDMQRNGCLPSLIAWNAVLRQQPCHIALSLFEQVRKSDLQLEFLTYNHVLSVCQKQQAWEGTLLVLEDMVERNVKPMRSTVQILSSMPDLHRQAPSLLMQLFKDDYPCLASFGDLAKAISTAHGSSTHASREKQEELPRSLAPPPSPPPPPPPPPPGPPPLTTFGNVSSQQMTAAMQLSQVPNQVATERQSLAIETELPGAASHSTLSEAQPFLEDSEDAKANDDSDESPMSYRLLPGGDAIIDLHGLPVEVARIAVQVALEDLLISPAPEFGLNGRGGNFIIITGRGKHSPGGEPMLRPAVLSLLREEFGIAADQHAVGRVRIPASELWRLRGVPAPSLGR